MPYVINVILVLLLILFAVLYLTGHTYKKKYDKVMDLLRFLVRYKRISPEEYKAAVGELPPSDIVCDEPIAEKHIPAEKVQELKEGL